MGCGASTPAARVHPNLHYDDGDHGTKENSGPKQMTRRAEEPPQPPPPGDRALTKLSSMGESSRLSGRDLRSSWTRSFLESDPRRHVAEYFKPGDERGPYGYLRAQGLRPKGASTEYFAVWRPTSLTAIRMLFDGSATGKGLNIKGKSAQKGPLSGFVPFLQIAQEEHKALVGTSPASAHTRIFYRSAVAREQARKTLTPILLEMEVRARQAARQLAGAKAGTVTLSDEETEAAAYHATRWTMERYEIVYIDDHLRSALPLFGLDLPERLTWEAYVVRRDISHEPGWETGRASEPGFMDLNLHAVRDGTEPKVALFQEDGRDPMNPRRLLMAHEESSGIRPVASDLDAFLIGSRGLAFDAPLAAEQQQLVHWQLNQMETILGTPRAQGWTKRWLEVLKTESAPGKPMEHGPSMPPYGFGDARTYDIMAKAVTKLQFCGAVRHGAECFNFWFPQELDEQYFVVWEGFLRYGSKMPWKYLTPAGLQEFLKARVEEGYAFPLNPKWIVCDEGWRDVFEHLRRAPHTRSALDAWLPPASGLTERIIALSDAHPTGFQPEAAPAGGVVENMEYEMAEYELKRHQTLQRARIKLRALYRFTSAARSVGAPSGVPVAASEPPAEAE